MIELKILVDDIDYNSLTELLVPLLAEKLEKDGKGGILGGVLSGNRNMAVSMARTLLWSSSSTRIGTSCCRRAGHWRRKTASGFSCAMWRRKRYENIPSGIAGGDFCKIRYFFRDWTAARRASTFSCVVAQLAQKRTAEWVASTRSQYS